MAQKIDLQGQRFGRLTVIKYSHLDKHNRIVWLCKCDCGNEKEIPSQNLVTGRTTSCGCYQKEIKIKNKTTHGLSHTRLFNTWGKIINRCTCETSKAYKYYGGRGITVCDEWRNDFMAFYNWAMDNGYEEHLTIDRIDNNGNYEPSNCRWVTIREQCNNRRTNRTFEVCRCV